MDHRRAAATSGRGPTLADVAARTGVAVSTVSRALSDPGRVNVVTRERIQTAAAELGYARRATGPGRGAHHETIAVLVPDTTNPFSFEIIRGTQNELKSTRRGHLLIDTEGSEQLEELLLTQAKGRCDGAVLAAPRMPDAQIEAVERATVPLVTINRPRPGGSSVVIDSPSGSGQAVEHLVSLGHRHLVYVSGPRNSWSSERRWRVIRRVAARYGVRVTRSGPHPPVQASGTAAAEAVINSGATGVLAFNDMMAISMLQRFAERGVRVPEDLSVVGCDNGFAAACCHPRLTTISAPAEQAGRLAVAILLAQGAERRRSVVLPTHLVVRESTGPAPVR